MIVLKLSAEESLTIKVAGRRPQRLRELLQRKYPFPSAYSRLKSVQNALCHQTTSNCQNTQTPQNILPFPKSLSLFSCLGHASSDQLHSSFLPPAAYALSPPSSSSPYAPGLLSLISSPSAPLTSCASPSRAPQQLPVPLHFRCFTGPRIQNGSQQVHKSSSTLLCSSSTPSAPTSHTQTHSLIRILSTFGLYPRRPCPFALIHQGIQDFVSLPPLFLFSLTCQWAQVLRKFILSSGRNHWITECN